MATSKRVIVVGSDAEGVSNKLRDVLANKLKEDRPYVIGLSGGSLPKFFAAAAVQLPSVSWSKVKFIFCDERLVPFDNNDSTFKVYKDNFISKVDGVSESNFVLIDPTLNASDAAKDYQSKLLQLEQDQASASQPGFVPRYDLLLLGMGPDGHTCSLFPGHPLLNETGLVVAPITDSPKPPPSRVTLTYPVLNNAQTLIFVCTGDGKKEIVKAILEDGADYPAGRVKPTNGELYWILDQPAAALLQK